MGATTAIAFSGANSFPLICNLLTSLPTNRVQTAPRAVKPNGKCGLTWHSSKSELKGPDRKGREATRYKDSCSKWSLHVQSEPSQMSGDQDQSPAPLWPEPSFYKGKNPLIL